MRLDEIIDIIRACRRSRVKLRTYDALKELVVATPAELADRARTTPERILAVMLGDGKDYRADTALVTIGVAEPRGAILGEAFALTTRGEAAHQLVRARLAR